MNDPLSRDVARRRGERVPTLSLANQTLEDVRPLIAEVNKLRNRVTGLNGLPASLKPEAKRCARLLDDAASVLVDIFKAAGEKAPMLSLANYNPQFRTLAAVERDLLSRLKDAEKMLSKISTAAAEDDDTEMMSKVSKGNAAVASIKKAAKVLGDITQAD